MTHRDPLIDLIHEYEVAVHVAERMDKVARLQTRHVRHHLSQQRITRNIERYAKENIGRALVKLTRKFSIGNIELEEAMAWW